MYATLRVLLLTVATVAAAVMVCEASSCSPTAAAPKALVQSTHKNYNVGFEDVNGDGFVDAVTSTLYSLFWYRGNPDGTFVSGSANSILTTATEYGFRGFSLRDWDGDGRPDLMVGYSRSSGGLWLYINSGSATTPFHGGLRIIIGAPCRVSFLVPADVDNDGDDDVICGCYDGYSIVTNDNGDGSAWSIAPSPWPDTRGDNRVKSISPVDLNGDGWLDFVVTSDGVSGGYLEYAVNQGLGDGAFSPLVLLSNTLASIRGATVASFAGPGAPPSIVTVQLGALRFWPGTPSQPLLFGSPNVIEFASISDGLQAPVVLDVGNDGRPDIALASSNGPVYLLFNDGIVSTERPFPFSIRTVDTLDHEPIYVRAADVNEDGYTDLVVAEDLTSSGNTWWYSTAPAGPNTTITFSSGTPLYLWPRNTEHIAHGLLNHDSVPDILLYSSEHRLAVLMGAGDGTFGSPTPVSTYAYHAIVIGDVSNDGANDLVAATTDEFSTGTIVVHVLLNDGTGSFTAPIISVTPLPVTPIQGTIKDIALADMDGDLYVDVVMTGWGTASPNPSGHIVAWWRNVNGTGVLAPTMTTITTASLDRPRLIEPIDIDADGDVDVVVGQAQSRTRVILNNGDGSFDSGAVVSSNSGSAWDLVIDDFNGDGVPDIIDVMNPVRLYINTGSWPTSTEHVIFEASVIAGCDAGDVDGDALTDLVVTTTSPSSLYVLRNRGGDGSNWTPQIILDSGVTIREPVTVVDINQDGFADILGMETGVSDVLLSDGLNVFGIPSTASRFNRWTRTCRTRPTPYFDVNCLWEAMRSVSRCAVSETLSVPDGTFVNCPTYGHRDVTWAVSLAASSPGAARIDCAGSGVLFRVTSTASSDSPASAGALSIDGLVVSGTGVGLGTPTASPGIRVDGSDTRLVLSNMVLANATASFPAGVFVSNEGKGGAVLVTAGTLEATNTTWTSNSAVSAGGALYVRAATAKLTNVRFEGNSAPLGGALLVGSGSTVSLDRAELSRNSAETGGGGVLVEPGAGAVSVQSSSFDANVASFGLGGGLATFVNPEVPVTGVVVAHTSFTDNTARAGGGVAVSEISGVQATASAVSVSSVPAATSGVSPTLAVALTLSDSTVSGNTGRVGGGVYACGAMMKVEGSSTVWTANEASGSGELARDALVCRSPSVPTGYSPDRTDRTRLLWIEPDAPAFAALDGANIHGPLNRISLVDPPPSLTPGSPVSGTVSAVELLGESVSDATASYTLDVDTGSGPVVAAGTIRGTMEIMPAPLPALSLFATADTVDAAFPLSVAAEIRLDDDASVAPLALTFTLDMCGVGQGGQGDTVGSAEVLRCAACAEDLFSDQVSMAPCEALPSCSENARKNGTGACECKTDFYRVGQDLVGAVCAACPVGATCAGGEAGPLALPGFYRIPNETRYLSCPRKRACPGGAGGCRTGYVGELCASCASNHYSNAAGDCVACPPASSGLMGLAMVGLVVVAGVLAVALLFGPGSSTDPVQDFRIRSLPLSPSMALVALQIVGIFADADLRWSSASQSALGAFNVANVDASMFASECSLASFHLKYAISVLLPFVVLCLVLVFLVVASLVLGKGLGVRRMVDLVLMSVAPLLYIPVSRSTLILFDCVKLSNGAVRLDSDPGVACFDSDWWSVFPVGLVGVFGFVIAVPVYFLVSLVLARHELFTPAVMARLGSLYKVYRTPYPFLGVADLVKRLALVLISMFLSEVQVLQLALLFAVLLVALTVNRTYQPYFFPLLNRFEFRVTLLELAVLVAGMGSYAERQTTRGDTLLLVFVIAIVVVLLGVVAWTVFQELGEMRAERKYMSVSHVARWDRLSHHILNELDDLDPGLAGELRAFVDGHMSSLEVRTDRARSDVLQARGERMAKRRTQAIDSYELDDLSFSVVDDPCFSADLGPAPADLGPAPADLGPAPTDLGPARLDVDDLPPPPDGL